MAARELARAKGLRVDTGSDEKKEEEEGKIMEGFLSKKRKIGWTKRFFTLTSRQLAYYNSPHDTFPNGFVSVKEMEEIIWRPDKNSRSIDIRLWYKTYQLVAESKDSASEWVAGLERAMAIDKERDQRKHARAQARTPSTPKFLRDGVAPHDASDELNSFAQTQFRLAFYQTALKHPDLLRKLMSDFRTDEQIFRLILEVCLERPGKGERDITHAGYESSEDGEGFEGGGSSEEDEKKEGDGGFKITISPSQPGNGNGKDGHGRGDGSIVASPSGSVIDPTGELRSLRSSGCSRFNPRVHASKLKYKRRRPISVATIPSQSDQARRPSVSPFATPHEMHDRASVSPKSAGGRRGGSRRTSEFQRAAMALSKSHDALSALASSEDHSGRRGSFMDDLSSSIQGIKKKVTRQELRRQPSMAFALAVPDSLRGDKHSQRFGPTPALSSTGMFLGTPTAPSHSRRASEAEFALNGGRNRGRSLAVGSAGGGSERTGHQRSYSSGHSPRRQRGPSVSIKGDGAKADRIKKISRQANDSLLTKEEFSKFSLAEKQVLYDWITSDAFLEAICNVFVTSEFEVQRLALRVVWVLLQRDNHIELTPMAFKQLAADPDSIPDECPDCHDSGAQFSDFMLKILTGYCNSRDINFQINNAVSALLFCLTTNINDFNGDQGVHKKFSAMGKDVRNYGIWKVIFTTLAQSEFHTRRVLLKEINSLLINHAGNCESILNQANWQQWMLPLLTDIPREMNNRLLEKTYYYTINVYTLLHFHCFQNYKTSYMGFERVFRKSLLAPLQNNREQIHLMRSFLQAMVMKIHFHHRQHVIFDADFAGCVWVNLRALLRLVKAFLFLTPSQSVVDRLECLYQDETTYGLHGPEHLEADMLLIDQSIQLLKAVHLQDIEIPTDYADVEPDEKEAFLAIKHNDALTFFHDASVFLPMVSKMDLNEAEIYELVREFLLADNPNVRKKVFQGARERHVKRLKQELKDEKKRSKQLEKEMKRMESRKAQLINLLLLGPGESGKSTFFKQLIVLHGSGFPEHERLLYKSVIFENVVQAAHTLCEQTDVLADTLQCTLTDEASVQAKAHILSLESPFTLTVETAKAIEVLWRDDNVRKVYAHRAMFQMASGDTAHFFFDKVMALTRQSYKPTVNDVLRSRMRTTGISETHFELDNAQFRIMDMGGQRSERKKWMFYFEDVTAMIFIAAISEYDQLIAEDNKTNRVQEALDLFKEMAHNKWLKKKAIILFLNKSDLFAEKIREVPLEDHFPAFAAEKNKRDFATGCKFLSGLFHMLAPKKEIFTHVTCATDTQQVEKIFLDVKDVVIRECLRDSGLMAVDL